MEAMTLREILQATGGTLLGTMVDLDTQVGSVDTDSRAMTEGALFVPLVGERFDGHAYIGKSLENGAVGTLTDHELADYRPDKFYVLVPDTLLALGDLAAYYRSKFDVKIIAVTGSDELNMVCCLAAKQLGAKYSIARIRDPEYTESLTLLQEKLDPLEAESVVRLTVTGSVLSEEYSRRQELYKKYFPNGGGSIFTFEIKGDAETAKKFIDNLELFSLLANVADVKSLVIHPASTTHAQLSEEELNEQGIYSNTIRLSIGTENIDDIIEDLEGGFQSV